jgi:hypothetical protein
MAKCFFYLKDASGAVERSLGLMHFDIGSSSEPVRRFALSVAQGFQPYTEYRSFFVVALEQSGKEIVRVPVAKTTVRPRLKRRKATSSDTFPQLVQRL